MKTYQQMAEDVLARRDQYQAQQKARRKKILTIVPCAGLVLLAGIGIWRHSATPSNDVLWEKPSKNTPASAAPITTSPAESNPPEGESEGIVVNWLTAGASSSADYDAIPTDYNDLSAEEWDAVSQLFAEAAGIPYDDFVQRIPDAMRKDITFYGLSTRKYTDGVASEEYYPHDYIFQCSGDNDSSATIAVCADEWPIRCVRVITDDMKQSWIHGIPVTVIGLNSTFYIYCEYHGAFYDIETYNVSQADLEALLNSLLAS